MAPNVLAPVWAVQTCGNAYRVDWDGNSETEALALDVNCEVSWAWSVSDENGIVIVTRYATSADAARLAADDYTKQYREAARGAS